MEFHLYPRTVTDNTLVMDLTSKVNRPIFSTRLHGGFHRASFTLNASLGEAWQWATKYYNYRLRITDNQHLLWEGRIEEPELDILGKKVGIQAYGYYANLSDVPYATAYNDHFDVILKAVLTAACAQINSDQSNIAATDITIDSAAAAGYLDTYPQQLVEMLSKFSDSTMGKWYFAIWEDRKPWLFKKSAAALDWVTSIADFKALRLTHRLADLWNSAYAVYDAGGLTRTATINDTDSQSKYDLTRRYVVPNLGTVIAAAAEAQRDAIVENSKDIYPRLSQIVLGDRVFTTGGKAYSSSWIRAGQVLRIQDLVPASGDAGSVALDGLRTFYIVETEYDVDRREMRIVPDTEISSLDSLLARKV